MNKLTTFQIRCESTLVTALRERGIDLVNRRLEGERERYIVAELPSHNITIWIYTDEPEISIRNKSLIYERPDYPDESKRISVFVEAVLSLVRGEQPADIGSKWFMFFRGKKL